MKLTAFRLCLVICASIQIFSGASGDTASLICDETTFNVSQSLKCILNLTFTCLNVDIEVDLGDDQYYFLNSQGDATTVFSRSYGAVVPTSLTSTAQTTAPSMYLGINTEFTEDSYLAAIELYAVNVTDVFFSAVVFNTSDLNETVASYIYNRGYAPPNQIQDIIGTVLQPGYNIYYILPTIFYPKGTMLRMTVLNGAIAIDNTHIWLYNYTDFSYYDDSFLPWSNSALYMRALANPVRMARPTTKSVSLSALSYMEPGTYQIIASVSCNGSLIATARKLITVIDGKLFIPHRMCDCIVFETN